MSTNTVITDFDKINQIYNWLLVNPRCSQSVTTLAISKVLRHKFNDINNITYEEVDRIDRGLRVPLRKEVVEAILELASKFEAEVVVAINYEPEHNVGFNDKNGNLQICA